MFPWEFSYWRAYAELNPFGESRADYRAGIIASAVFNSSGKQWNWTKPSDHVPDWDTLPPEDEVQEELIYPGQQSTAEIEQRMRIYAQQWNAYLAQEQARGNHSKS
jgi:hypothetical protein